MNIKPEQLQNSLSSQLESIYFAFGAEILLVEQSLSIINAAARENGLTYSKLIAGLKRANIDLDRKTLANIAVNDKEAFTKIAEEAKSQLAA